jgi:hypothetical protein
MLWAALGRLAVPPARDTVMRVSGDTLRADIGGADRAWRVTLRGRQVAALEHTQNGRIIERVTRDSAAIRYNNLVTRRSLAIAIQRLEGSGAYPASIWAR